MDVEALYKQINELGKNGGLHLQEVFGSGQNVDFVTYKHDPNGRPPLDKIPRISFTSMKIEDLKDVKRPNFK